MNMQEARRLAHATVVPVLRVQQEFYDSDLWQALEALSENDQARVAAAVDEIIEYHARRGGLR